MVCMKSRCRQWILPFPSSSRSRSPRACSAGYCGRAKSTPSTGSRGCPQLGSGRGRCWSWGWWEPSLPSPSLGIAHRGLPSLSWEADRGRCRGRGEHPRSGCGRRWQRRGRRLPSPSLAGCVGGTGRRREAVGPRPGWGRTGRGGRCAEHSGRSAWGSVGRGWEAGSAAVAARGERGAVCEWICGAGACLLPTHGQQGNSHAVHPGTARPRVCGAAR